MNYNNKNKFSNNKNSKNNKANYLKMKNSFYKKLH